jgi:hypothetical protein
MAEPSPSGDFLSTNLPEMPGTSASEQDGAPDENSFKSRFRRNKLLVVLSAAALGGVILGVGGMTVIAYLQPAAKEYPPPPTITAPPVPDAKHEALVEELNELKTKNEKLEEQLKQVPPAPEVAPLPAPATVSEPAPIPIPVIVRSHSASDKDKVTADCTVPDKDQKLGEKLKSCIEGFNASTH